MGTNDHVHRIFQEILKPISPPNTGERIKRLGDIEKAIDMIRPDAGESLDILDAITAGLQKRYGEAALEAALYASHFYKALERLDNCLETDVSGPDEDAAYEDWRARREP